MAGQSGDRNKLTSRTGTPALRFAIAGTGFWSRFQLAAWLELKGAECVALYSRTRGKAEALAREFGIPAVYDAAGGSPGGNDRQRGRMGRGFDQVPAFLDP